jgi:hypothetical protein
LGTNWGYIYEGFFSPEIHNGYIIMYIHTEIFGNKQQLFGYEHLCKVWLNFAFLFEKKNAIFRKGTFAHFDAKL